MKNFVTELVFATTLPYVCCAFSHPGQLAFSSRVTALHNPRSSEMFGLHAAANNNNDSSSTSSAILDNSLEATNSAANGATEISPSSSSAAKEGAAGEEEELTETQKLLKQVKEAGTAGAISYAAWELAFWGISIPICIVGYRQLTGHWPDLSNSEDLQKVGAEAFAFVNFARFAVPLRIGLALSTTGWVQTNVVEKFIDKKE